MRRAPAVAELLVVVFALAAPVVACAPPLVTVVPDIPVAPAVPVVPTLPVVPVGRGSRGRALPGFVVASGLLGSVTGSAVTGRCDDGCVGWICGRVASGLMVASGLPGSVVCDSTAAGRCGCAGGINGSVGPCGCEPAGRAMVGVPAGEGRAVCEYERDGSAVSASAAAPAIANDLVGTVTSSAIRQFITVHAPCLAT